MLTLGNGPAEFQWPRGIAVLPGNEFAIADSCNNRVQLFNSNCHVIGNVGKYGLENGQFDGLPAFMYTALFSLSFQVAFLSVTGFRCIC